MAPRKTTAKRSTRKTAAKKKTVKAKAKTKKTAKRKTTAKKSAGSAVRESFTKTQILNSIADDTGLSKKEVTAVFDSLSDIIERHIKKRAVGAFTLPGTLKIYTVNKPATKARKGINPFTGEPTIFKAKPARTIVKVKPLKKLKDMAS